LPKNSPETASRTDLVSKLTPFTNVHGISMMKKPMAPMARPGITRRIQVPVSRWRTFSRS
jgi:hypothetical protein